MSSATPVFEAGFIKPRSTIVPPVQWWYSHEVEVSPKNAEMMPSDTGVFDDLCSPDH